MYNEEGRWQIAISIPDANSHSARYRACILGAHWSQCSLNGAEINSVVGSRILICLEHGEIDKAQVWYGTMVRASEVGYVSISGYF